jgi:hypothetical protein
VVVSPETCDPPDPTLGPNGQPVCRPDCTACGDGLVQANDDESCDDGNLVSGCRTDKPQKPLDGCLDNCQEPICEDPSKIKVDAGGLDVIEAHGRLIAVSDVNFRDGPLRVRISRQVCSHDAAVVCASSTDCEALFPGSTCGASGEGAVVFEVTVPGEGLANNNPFRWRYRNAAAKTTGGLYSIQIKGKTTKKRCAGGGDDGAPCAAASDCSSGVCYGYYAMKLKAYGDASHAVEDMQTEIAGGGHHWAVRGVWEQRGSSWRLGKKSEFLAPY